jgi:hypothetical protein
VLEAGAVQAAGGGGLDQRHPQPSRSSCAIRRLVWRSGSRLRRYSPPRSRHSSPGCERVPDRADDRVVDGAECAAEADPGQVKFAGCSHRSLDSEYCQEVLALRPASSAQARQPPTARERREAGS